MVIGKNAERIVGAIERIGKSNRGRKHLLAHLRGDRLTRQNAILAFCYECQGFSATGSSCEKPECPLYPYSQHSEEANLVARERRNRDPSERNPIPVQFREPPDGSRNPKEGDRERN